MAAAQLKLLAAISAEGRSAAARVAARFHLDPVGWFRNAESKEVLPALAAAVWTTRRIRIRYESWAGVVDRELDPLGLALREAGRKTGLGDPSGMSPQGLKRLQLAPGRKRLSALAPAVVEMAARTGNGCDEAGWTRVSIPIESIEHAAGEVLKLGAEAEVLTPIQLRQRMAEITAQLGAIYPATA